MSSTLLVEGALSFPSLFHEMALCHCSSVCRSISKLNVSEQKALVPQ